MTEYAPVIAFAALIISICGIAYTIFTHKFPSDLEK